MLIDVVISKNERGTIDLFLDGVNVADKVSSLGIFMEAGEPPHMMLAMPFVNLTVDGVDMEVTQTSYETQKEVESIGELAEPC